MDNIVITASNLKTLLFQYIDMGFSFYSLSLAVNISVEDLNLLYNSDSYSSSTISYADIMYLHIFLNQLLLSTPDDPVYFSETIKNISNYFSISYSAIAQYLGITENKLENLIAHPEDIPMEQGYKIIHLALTFLRNQRYSTD